MKIDFRLIFGVLVVITIVSLLNPRVVEGHGGGGGGHGGEGGGHGGEGGGHGGRGGGHGGRGGGHGGRGGGFYGGGVGSGGYVHGAAIDFNPILYSYDDLNGGYLYQPYLLQPVLYEPVWNWWPFW